MLVLVKPKVEVWQRSHSRKRLHSGLIDAADAKPAEPIRTMAATARIEVFIGVAFMEEKGPAGPAQVAALACEVRNQGMSQGLSLVPLLI